MIKTNPRDYPETMSSAETGRPMVRGEKPIAITVDGQTFTYNQPGWWCSLTDPNDLEGELVDEDNQVRQMVRRTAQALAAGETLFVPIVIRAIREQCGLTQREAGIVFGTGDNSFDNYESGEIQPSGPIKRLLKLAMEQPDLFRLATRGEAAPTLQTDAALIQKTLHAAAIDHIYAPLFVGRGLSQSDMA